MCNRRNRKKNRLNLETSNIAYWTIRVMHDNPILPLVRNPHKLLHGAGLTKGQKVIEVGCGPGFFTIPAARIVGNEGHIYAVDIHPRAVDRVKKKIKKAALTNVTPLCVNASNTGLPDRSIDLAFLFGLRSITGGFESMILELNRVLKPGGILSFERAKKSEKKLIKEVERGGFAYTEKRGRIFVFKREGE
jgi:ubiquinone/menaquinone biosynthesis C-methylase UbiE